MIEVGNSASVFKPYQGAELTVALPETVYGGMLDWDTGKLTITHRGMVLNGTEDWKMQDASIGKFYLFFDETQYAVKGWGMCSHYKYGNAYANVEDKNVTTNRTALWLADNTYKSLSELKAYLAAQYAAGTPVVYVYELENSTQTYQLTAQQLTAIDGINFVYSDCGDTCATFNYTPILDIVNNLATKAADAAVVGQRITEIDNAIFDTALGKNLLNPATVSVGYLKTDGTLSTYGSNVNYDTSDYIRVATNTSYTVTTVKNTDHSIMTTTKVVHLYDDSKQSISGGHFEAKSQQTLTFNTGNAAYVRVSGQTRAAVDGDNVCSVQLEKGDAFTGYEPYSVLNKVPKIASPGILYGKKYVACGDSFTAGDFTGYVDENGLSGKNSPVLYDSEWKMYKTYPWWIAKRNNMTLVLDAQNGTTMALDKTYVADPENVDINTRNPFANERYKRIPSDADYITIWFGLNDANGNTNLGTIDDADNTTFYGAWNVVLEYLLVNHPYAKVGIIVTDGRTDSEYQDAVREVAKKWGFPYLDLVADPQVPAMINGRDAEMGLCARAKELRNAAFMVTASNFHPGIKAHEYRSTIIENWLRTL